MTMAVILEETSTLVEDFQSIQTPIWTKEHGVDYCNVVGFPVPLASAERMVNDEAVSVDQRALILYALSQFDPTW